MTKNNFYSLPPLAFSNLQLPTYPYFSPLLNFFFFFVYFSRTHLFAVWMFHL